MIHKFVIKLKNVMILICSFYINFFRFNLQNLCHNVHFWNISMLKVLLMKAIEHVRHLSQKHIIKIYNYTILNSFNIKKLETHQKLSTIQYEFILADHATMIQNVIQNSNIVFFVHVLRILLHIIQVSVSICENICNNIMKLQLKIL